MRTRRSLFLAGLLGLAVVSACTTESPGDPQPVDSTFSSRTSENGEELPFAGAPKVEDPLDTSRYERDPCLSLTAEQAQSLSLPPTGVPMENAALSVGCRWQNPETRGYANIISLSMTLVG